MGGMVMPQIAFGSLGHSFCSFQASSHQSGANHFFMDWVKYYVLFKTTLLLVL